jgi:hypothetical protein
MQGCQKHFSQKVCFGLEAAISVFIKHNKRVFSKFWGGPYCIWDSHFGLLPPLNDNPDYVIILVLCFTYNCWRDYILIYRKKFPIESYKINILNNNSKILENKIFFTVTELKCLSLKGAILDSDCKFAFI